MDCAKCHHKAASLYLYQEQNGVESRYCLRCLASSLWDDRISNKENNEDYFTIEGNDVATFLNGLEKMVVIDGERALYRQRNSNNNIIVNGNNQSSLLQCLDITISINKA